MNLLCASSKKQTDSEREPYRLTKEQYVRRCLAPVCPNFLAEVRVFQQDNAGPHASAEEYFSKKGVGFLQGWPPRSPQLNPIETLWSLLQARVSEHHPQSREELVDAIEKEWDAIPQSTVDKLVLSFPARLRDCVKRKGLI